MTSIRDKVESLLLPYVQYPLRYAGNELNIIRKDLSTASLHGVLCFPEIYDIGMSHHGGQILYHIINSRPSWALARAYQPWTDAEEIMRKNQIPLYTLEYFTAIKDADWIGFSVQYELQFTNMLTMLDLAGLPVLSRERGDAAPPVIAGGPCIANPEPLADFIDAFLVGDGEEALVQICESLEKTKSLPRTQRLGVLAEIPGVFVPSIPRSGPIRPARISALNQNHAPSKPLVPLMEVVHHRLAVEVMRGCTRGCRFCSAGTYYRPVRERDPDEVRSQIENGVASSGWREVGLLSLSTADYSCLSDLLATAEDLREVQRLAVTLPSTRVDALTSDQFAAINRISGSSSFTIAPEAGSMRLRKIINKDFTDEQILDMARLLFHGGVETLKLYFMVGLPRETEEDISALVDLVRRVARVARDISHRKQVNVSLSPFSPKPHTPFQWEPMDSVESLRQKSRRVKYDLGTLKNVKVSYRDPWITFLETVMARGDRRLGEVILQAWREGARFDGWEEHFSIERWKLAATKVGMDLDFYIQARTPGEKLPWSNISTGVSETFLLEERTRAYNEEFTEDCRTGCCSNCGACDSRVSIRHGTKRVSQSESLRHEPTLATSGSQRYRYRFTYRKDRLMRYSGHHDMMRIIQRAFVAVEMPLEYSQGYKPAPRMGFGPPLPMGAMGLTEYLDVILVKPLPQDWQKVNRFLPDGLSLYTVSSISLQAPSITEGITMARHRFEPLGEEISPEILSRRIDLLKARDSVEITEERKGAAVQKDLKPLIESILVEGVLFEAALAAAPGRTCRPADLLSVLFPERATSDFLITRCEYR